MIELQYCGSVFNITSSEITMYSKGRCLKGVFLEGIKQENECVSYGIQRCHHALSLIPCASLLEYGHVGLLKCEDWWALLLLSKALEAALREK